MIQKIKVVKESPKLRIGFTGAQGSGKTTIAEYVINKYGFKYSYINQTRKVIKTIYGGSLEKARKDAIEFQNTLINKKLFWERRHSKYGYVTDRTTIDNIAYYLAYSESPNAPEALKYIDKGITHARKSYDIIFCLSPILNTPDDPLSPPDTLEKFKLYYIILGLLSLVQSTNPELVKYIYVRDLNARKSLIDNYIEEQLRTY